MSGRICRRTSRAIVAFLFLVAGAHSALAQPPGEAPVRFVEARSYRISEAVELTGTVESRLTSSVASEVEGLVTDFPVRVGQQVKEGDILAQLRRTTLEMRLQEAEAQLREDEARLKLAERTLERTRELLEKGAVSQQQLDDDQFEFNALMRRAERLQVVIGQLHLDLERTIIRAPFSGIVTRENTQIGEWLEVGGTVVEILSLADLEVSVELPERYFSRVRVGSRVPVSFASLPGTRVTGEVSAIIPQADPTARTFPVKIRIPTLNGRIGVGTTASIRIGLGTAVRVTIVPKDAVVSESNMQYVFVAESGIARKTTISIGRAIGSWVEVVSGIVPGQPVITRGNERLRDGQTIAAEPDETEYDLS